MSDNGRKIYLGDSKGRATGPKHVGGRRAERGLRFLTGRSVKCAFLGTSFFTWSAVLSLKLDILKLFCSWVISPVRWTKVIESEVLQKIQLRNDFPVPLQSADVQLPGGCSHG